MTAHGRLGTLPTLAEQVDELRAMVLDQRARIEALEAENNRRDDAVADGSPRPGRWLKMKAAMSATNYSRSGLLKLCKQGRIRFDFEGAHRVIDVTSVPRKYEKSAHCT